MFGGAHGWISREEHPIAFWGMVTFDAFMLIALSGLAAFVARENRNAERRLRRLNIRPPTESAIDQTSSER
jgi:hypothetical protein